MSQSNFSIPGNLSTPSFSQTVSTSNTATVGNFLGQQLLQANNAPSLTDCAEEISLHMSEKTEEKEFHERKVEPETHGVVVSEEEIEEYMESGKGEDAEEKLMEFVKAALSGSVSDIGRQASESFSEKTEQYCALQYALKKGEQQGASASVLDQIKEAAFTLQATSGGKIRADLNSIGSAARFGSNAEEIKQFQNAYSDIVLGESSLSKTLDLALERFSGKNVKEALTQLTNALGRDLSSDRASTDKTHLTALIKDMYQIEVAHSVLERCSALTGGNIDGLYKQSLTKDPVALMRSLVNITADRWANGSQFITLARENASSEPTTQIHFLTQVRNIMRDIPVQIFTDADGRNNILDAAQHALDQVIEESEQ